MGVQFRTALLVWAVSVGTLLIFLLILIPDQRKSFLESLESRAFAITSALQNITTGAVINEDYSSVVAQCLQILSDDKSIEYLVVSRNDGFSLVHDSTGQWRTETLSNEWRPDQRESYYELQVTPLFDKRVFHYSKPFDYSSIQWGWIHVGLSLNKYDSSVTRSNQKIVAVSILCIVLSFFASLYYARLLVSPILNLQAVVKNVARGNLATRAVIESPDEVGSLANSFNSMTEALSMKDRILSSICFAAQQALCNSNWTDVTQDILSKLGSASKVGRSYLYENGTTKHGTSISSLRYEWINPEILREPQDRVSTITWSASGLKTIMNRLQNGSIAIESIKSSDKSIQAFLKSQSIQSVLLIPIMINDSCWGFLGFDECSYRRKWTDAEQESLGAAANLLGAAIEKEKAQDALIEAKASAEAANEAKSQFLATMSHEVRNPISGIISTLQLLGRQPLNERCRSYSENALTSAESLLKVVGGVLDFSKIESGKMELVEKDFSLKLTVESVISIFAVQAEEKGIKLSFQIKQSTTNYLVGDPNRLHQILVNLIGNAIKFTEKGAIEILCETEEKNTHEMLLKVQVRDTGIGISKNLQEDIFNAFTQADSTMIRSQTGTGLGLQICRQLCQLMGGEIGMKSEQQKGSTFWLNIPFRKSELQPSLHSGLQEYKSPKILDPVENKTSQKVIREAIESQLGETETAITEARSPNEKVRSPSRGEHCPKNVHSIGEILLVEDNDINIQLTTELVFDLGYRCKCASNGLEAIQALEIDSFDLILMDCQMPIMDGYEATRTIRLKEETSIDSNRSQPSIPIVALTAHALEYDRQRCIDAGMNDYLSKPIEPDLLGAMLRKWIPTTDSPAESFSPTASSSSKIPIAKEVDFPRLLKRCNGKKDLAKRLIRRFLLQAHKDIQIIEDAIRSEDPESVKLAAHRLKGASKNTSTPSIAKTATQLEALGIQANLPLAANLVLNLKQQVRNLEIYFEDLKGSVCT